MRWLVAVVSCAGAACGGGHKSSVDAGISDSTSTPDAAVNSCAPTTTGALCSPDRLCWDDPLPQGSPIAAISGRSCDTWLATDQPYLLRMNGTSVSRVAAPNMYGAFTQIAAFASYDVWTTSFANEDGFEHFDGTSWTVVSNGMYTGIWGTANNDLWLAKAGALQHWDGATVTDVPTPGPSQQLGPIVGSSGSDVWAVGSTPLHYDGSTWTAMPAPGGFVLGMWGTDPEHWYAVGEKNPNGIIWRWDGTSWSVVYTEPAPQFSFSQMFAIGGLGPNDVWAGGPALDHVVHYDGTSWTPVPLPAPAADINAIQAVGTGDLVFAGAHGYLARWDGSTLGAISHWSGATEDWFAAWGSSPSDVWMFGSAGAAQHYDGTGWTTSTIPGAGVLFGASGTSASDVWAAGQSSTTGHTYATHWNGSAWSGVDLGTAGVARAVYAAATNDVWVVTDAGAALHYNGTTWLPTTTGVTTALYGVWGNASDAWATGPSLLHWNGTAWSAVTSPSQDPMQGVWGRTTNDIFFADDYGGVYEWNGSAFSTLPLNHGFVTSTMGGEAARIWNVHIRDVDFDNGTGNGLKRLDSLINMALYGAYFPSATDGWIGAGKGARLRYRP